MTRPLRAAAVLALLAAALPAAADDELTPKEVLSVMNHRRMQIRKICWESSPEKADTSVKVDFAVAANGVVVDATGRDASGPPSIVACIVAEMKKTTFPASAKGGKFRWPFVFKGP